MPLPKPSATSAVTGRRILITRTADRAKPLASLLGNLGAEPLLLPLIDFERAQDQASLDAAMDALAAGGFDWLVVSSSTTVRALMENAAGRGAALVDLIPAGTQVATVGASTQRVLESVGLRVALAPSETQSAEGLLALWDPAPARVFLPQADLAAPGLRQGLAARGADVTAVTAYHTVDFPASEERRLTAELPAGVVPSETSTLVLTPLEVGHELEAGRIDAVVAASPSAVRRIAGLFPQLAGCCFIAIGPPTAAAASALGITVAAIAPQPTPDGIVSALESVFANEGNLP